MREWTFARFVFVASSALLAASRRRITFRSTYDGVYTCPLGPLLQLIGRCGTKRIATGQQHALPRSCELRRKLARRRGLAGTIDAQ